jgi:hypothetical protein
MTTEDLGFRGSKMLMCDVHPYPGLSQKHTRRSFAYILPNQRAEKSQELKVIPTSCYVQTLTVRAKTI